ncbi:ribonuclease Z [Joostella atrarenae]|uniref:Ribonuclease Z n=1 Tax=Joostella atrarenae TaxID=679257 RepID=A0ABS9J2I9_9FLAO|nr:ribonuclease Z [Joostella atrarenae]MCF8714647.1 ribonuclease Z [Joostella atrarenae]
MIIDKRDNITVITQESVSLDKFVQRLKDSYKEVQHTHVILNLLSLSNLKPEDMMEFLEISRDHRAAKKSFVIVTNSVNLNEVDEHLIVAPTLEEAYDVIEMEDIERDLDF